MHALKILEEDDQHAVIGGYGVVFGGDDQDGEGFEPDTDYMLDLVPVKPVFIDHSEGGTVTTADGKTYKLAGIHEPVGRVIEVTPDNVGLYMKLQFEKSGRYWQLVEQMVQSGKAGLASGTVGHLARRKGNRIVRWPIVEESITMTPAEPRTVGIERLKHVAEVNPTLKALIPEAAGEAAADGAADGESLDRKRERITDAFMRQFPRPPATGEDDYVDWWVVEVYDDHLIARLLRVFWYVDFSDNGRAVEFAPRDTWTQVEKRHEWVEAVKRLRAKSRNPVVTESDEMSDMQPTPDATDLKSKVDALSENVNKIIKALENSPALKSAGYTTDDGGTADPTHKSFGDFLLAVKRRDVKRLGGVYGATKDMAEGAGTTGGYLVPTEFHNELLRVMGE